MSDLSEILNGPVDPYYVENLAGEVAKGAAYLDEVRPGWANEIDLVKMRGDWYRDSDCQVLSQLYGDFHKAMEAFGKEWTADYAFAPRSIMEFAKEPLEVVNEIGVDEIVLDWEKLGSRGKHSFDDRYRYGFSLDSLVSIASYDYWRDLWIKETEDRAEVRG